MTQVLQVHFNFVPQGHASPSKSSKRDSFVPTGRGGSGNIRRSSVSTNDSSSADRPRPSELRPASPEIPADPHSPAEKKRFTSSGRGGSGNIQPSAAGLEAHPLTASILSRHSAVQAEYEQRIRKAHAESNMVRSSGRGGSGNISDPRRRSRSHEPRTAAKRRFFTAKGRERGTERCDGITPVTQHGQDYNMNRTSLATFATCSSESSGALEARYSTEGPYINVLASRNSQDLLPSDDAGICRSRKRLRRRGRLPPPLFPPPSTSPIPPPEALRFEPIESPPTISPVYPQSYHSGSPGSNLDVHPTMSESAILEDIEEYLSFLNLDL